MNHQARGASPGFLYGLNCELKVKFNEITLCHLICQTKKSIIKMYDYAKIINGGDLYVY